MEQLVRRKQIYFAIQPADSDVRVGWLYKSNILFSAKKRVKYKTPRVDINSLSNYAFAKAGISTR